MLKPEAAKKQLAQWRAVEENESRFNNEVAVERYLPALEKLSKKARLMGLALLELDAQGESSWNDWEQRALFQQQQYEALDRASKKDRLALLRIFFGPLAEDIEAAWQWMKNVPPSGIYGTPVRYPQLPEQTLAARQRWLASMIQTTAPYRHDVLSVPWLASWAPHLQSGWRTCEEEVGILAAATIDGGGKQADTVFEILCQSARKEHEIGGMGRHVIVGLLSAGRAQGWELMEKMILAAQRQEGLRQSILQAVPGAHPEALRRMLRLIVEHNLARFSSVVQAMDHWFGMAWGAAAAKIVHNTIAAVLDLFDDASARQKALKSGDPESAFLALWAIANADGLASIAPAVKLLQHAKVELRYVAALHLGQVSLPDGNAALVKALDDPDLRVALIALRPGAGYFADAPNQQAAYFEALEHLLERMPSKPTKLKPLVWPWTEQQTDRNQVCQMLIGAIGDLPPTRLIPHLPSLGPHFRSQAAQLLANQQKWDAATRETMLHLVGDASADVRKTAMLGLAKAGIQSTDLPKLEAYLTRTTADLRNGVINLILALSDKDCLASADRLLSSGHKEQRLAGLEILRQLSADNRQRKSCIAQAIAWSNSRKTILKAEQVQLNAIAESRRKTLTLDNALGLMNPEGRTPGMPPRKRKVRLKTAAAGKILQALDDLVHKHREEKVTFRDWQNRKQESLLGELKWGFAHPDLHRPAVSQIQKLPLHEIWRDWYENRPAGQRDGDGLELLRTWVLYALLNDNSFGIRYMSDEESAVCRTVRRHWTAGATLPKLRYPTIVRDVLHWMLALHPLSGAAEFILDCLETSCALVPQAEIEALRKPIEPPTPESFYRGNRDQDWRQMDVIATFKTNLHTWGGDFPQPLFHRYWRLLRWIDEPCPGARRQRPDFGTTIAAYVCGEATLDDVADHLLGPGREIASYSCRAEFGSLNEITARRMTKEGRAFATRPEIANLVAEIRKRLLDIELARGEAATPTTDAALAVEHYTGVETLRRLLAALGKQGFKKNTSWQVPTANSRPATFTELVSKTFPAEDDTPEAFARLMRQAIQEGQFPEERLLQLAFLAPQWTAHVEATLGWDGFSEALYWFVAHMRYVWGIQDKLDAAAGSGMEQEIDEAEEEFGDAVADDREDESTEGAADAGPQPQKLSHWERLIRERTPLTAAERNEGAIDLDWFRRTYARLTPKRWQALADAAKFAATGPQAKKAQFVADVLLGKASKKDLIDGIRKRNLKENVRLLGLLPLENATKRDADLANRYEVLQEYRRYANQLSSMTKPEALRACDIGLRNLASTAGYADPVRLQWAMEAASTRDLAAGPVQVSHGDVTMSLALNGEAVPQLSIARAGKPLKALPAALKKEKKFAELRERSTQLKRQSSRVKQSLEAAMCRGDAFSGAELAQLAEHALLWPQLSRLVLVGEGILGYPVKGGKALRDHTGKLEPVKKNEQIRIAHPHDLLQAGDWDRWQHECFQAERMQPFKQVFRELYVVTAQEKKDRLFTVRYAGQQVQPRQAYALWGQRGWSVDEYFSVFKAFHDEGLQVSVNFDYGITTPLEVEGLTIDRLEFRQRETYDSVPLTAVSPRIFSEVMRDMDLVVSVAHAGGVDPEASASTVEMRASLLRETCDLLNLSNVRLKDSRAIIKGGLGEYTIHLGSGVVHRMPGGAVCLVPVHSQHRGRLFLPFADDDPRTAEVISKTLLLARDEDIDDPIILQQLRAMV